MFAALFTITIEADKDEIGWLIYGGFPDTDSSPNDSTGGISMVRS